MSRRKIRFEMVVVVALALTGWAIITAKRLSAKPGKIFAQQLVEEAVAKHPELTGVELASTPPHQQCATIAATEAKEVGEKCDEDEFTAMKTNKPFVEKEKEGGKHVYDITTPLHDAAGKVIGTVGMDFKPEPGQQESKVVELAQQIVRELEAQIPSKAKLFEPAK